MSDSMELVVLIILFLVMFGSPIVALTIFMVQRGRRRHNLSIVIQERLIHADRKALSNEEKKVFRRQTHDIIWFLILSLAFLIMFAMVSDFIWNESNSRTSTYTLIISYVAIETGVALGSLRNVRHLLPWCRNYLTKGYVAHVYNIEGGERSFEIAFYDRKRDKIASRNKSIMNLDIQWQFNYKNMIPQQMMQYKSLSPTEILTPRETAKRIQNGIGEIFEREGKFPKEGELIDIVIRERGRRSVLVCIPLDQHFGENEN